MQRPRGAAPQTTTAPILPPHPTHFFDERTRAARRPPRGATIIPLLPTVPLIMLTLPAHGETTMRASHVGVASSRRAVRAGGLVPDPQSPPQFLPNSSVAALLHRIGLSLLPTSVTRLRRLLLASNSSRSGMPSAISTPNVARSSNCHQVPLRSAPNSPSWVVEGTACPGGVLTFAQMQNFCPCLLRLPGALAVCNHWNNCILSHIPRTSVICPCHFYAFYRRALTCASLLSNLIAVQVSHPSTSIESCGLLAL